MIINRLLIMSVLSLAIVSVAVNSNKTIAAPDSTTCNNPQPEQRRSDRPGPPPDFAGAAKKLGITVDKLKEALGLPLEPPPRADIHGAAVKLNVSEEKLIEVLGLPPRPANK